MKAINKYKIITNVNGRRILVINELIDIDADDSLSYDDFDAIFIDVVHRSYEMSRLIVRLSSPQRTAKCYLKPRFATTSLEEYLHFAAYLIDGFCSTPLDESFSNFIEAVYANIEKYSLSTDIGDTTMLTTAHFLSNIIRFDMSRGRTTYTTSTIRGIASGFTKSYLVQYDNQETLQYDERMKFNMKIEELGFATKKKFVERIHTCPNCGHSHLLFIESCPKCGSSNIRQESMIHHFRCANISPESTYNYDGDLVCPKCRQHLKHIGIDYDRPASIYTCDSCGNTFLTSTMKVICSSCNKENTPEELTPIDVWEYQLTRSGLMAFATNDALYQIESRDIYSGHVNYEAFENSIKSFPTMPSYTGHVLIIYRYKFEYSSDDKTMQLFDVMRAILSKMATVMITNKGNNLYLLILAMEDNYDHESERIKRIVEQLFGRFEEDGFYVKLIKSYIFEQSDSARVLLAQLESNTDDVEVIPNDGGNNDKKEEIKTYRR